MWLEPLRCEAILVKNIRGAAVAKDVLILKSAKNVTKLKIDKSVRWLYANNVA